MEKRSKFDEAIRESVYGLEDEPSAAVWAGIRSEIGPAVPPGRAVWTYRILVAASIAFLFALAFLLNQKEDRQTAPIATQQGVETKPSTPVAPPAPSQWASEPQNRRTPRPEKVLPWYGPAYPERENAGYADESGQPLPEMKQRDTPVESPAPEQFVERTPEEIEEVPVPEMIPVPQTNDQAIAENTSPPVRRGRNRSFRLPRVDDLNTEKIKEKSRGILGSIASGARDVLGIDARYAKTEKADTRTTAFNANFGLFRIKKVKTVKTKQP
ncbi:MAG: hypothetical protein AAGN35_25695 [Bacteroidota bacterium]